MANSYTQIHIQFVFAVKYRAALIGNEWKERLHQYMTGIFQGNKHKMLQINSPDSYRDSYFYWNETTPIYIIINSKCKNRKQ